MSIRRGRTGFTLIEMLTVMGALSVVMALGATLLLAAMRSDQVAASTLRGLAWRAELADQFRADVAAADTIPDRLGELARGPACLILHRPDGDHVVYRWREGQLERVVHAGGQETRWLVTVGENVVVEFGQPVGTRPLVTLRLVETPARGVARRTEVSAALGGDVQ